MFDAHTHIHDQRLSAVFSELTQKAVSARITGVCTCGTTQRDWNDVARVADQPLPFVVLPAFGIHPWFSAMVTPAWETELHGFLDRYPTALVGEIGLDGLRGDVPRDQQRNLLLRQIEIAYGEQRSLVLHGARVWGELTDILTQHRNQLKSFMVHGFSGSQEILRRILNLGGYISIGGAVCNANAAKLRALVIDIPESQLLLETDCPDLFPLQGHVLTHSQQQKPLNHPANLSVICKTVAQLRHCTPDELSDSVGSNARRFFL